MRRELITIQWISDIKFISFPYMSTYFFVQLIYKVDISLAGGSEPLVYRKKNLHVYFMI